jgi:hypothetical protein
MGPPRIRGTRPHLKAVLHNPQRQPGELVRTAAPPDIPSGLACCGQGLGHQGRLSDARLALDPDNRSLATAEGLHGSTQNYKLIFATYPSRGPVLPHARNHSLYPRWTTMRGALCYLQFVDEARRTRRLQPPPGRFGNTALMDP